MLCGFYVASMAANHIADNNTDSSTEEQPHNINAQTFPKHEVQKMYKVISSLVAQSHMSCWRTVGELLMLFSNSFVSCFLIKIYQDPLS